MVKALSKTPRAQKAKDISLTPRNNNPKSPGKSRLMKVAEVKYHVKRIK